MHVFKNKAGLCQNRGVPKPCRCNISPAGERGRGWAWGPGFGSREVRPRSREVLLVLQVKTRLLEEKGLRGAAGAAAGERLGEVG